MKKFKLIPSLIIPLVIVSLIFYPIMVGAENTDYPQLNYSELYEGLYPVDYIIIDVEDLDIIDMFNIYSDMDLLFLEDDELFAIFQEGQYLMNVQARAVEVYGILMDYFLTEINGNIELLYPDNYAGAYVDYDVLVIQLTDITDEATVFYRNLLGADAPIRFKQVDFSLNQLVTFGEYFVKTMDAPLVSFGFDTTNNSFNIVLDQSSDASIQMVENFDFDVTARSMPIPISIELGESPVTTTLRGGAPIARNRNMTNAFSVGLTGYRAVGNAPALLTTGHAFPGASVNTRVYMSDGSHIGYLAAARAGTYAVVGVPGTVNGDWAVINLNNIGSMFLTNLLMDGTRITGTSTSPPVNSVVRGTGRMTRAWQGTVTQVNINVCFGERVGIIQGITRVAYSGSARATGGDSGGTIVRSVGSSHVMGGVHVGASTNYWYFSPLAWTNHIFRPRTS